MEGMAKNYRRRTPERLARAGVEIRWGARTSVSRLLSWFVLGAKATRQSRERRAIREWNRRQPVGNPARQRETTTWCAVPALLHRRSEPARCQYFRKARHNASIARAGQSWK